VYALTTSPHFNLISPVTEDLRFKSRIVQIGHKVACGINVIQKISALLLRSDPPDSQHITGEYREENINLMKLELNPTGM